MDQKQDVTIESLASLSLAKCLLRMSRVTAGTWQVTGTKMSSGTLMDALKQHDFGNRAAVVYFNLRGISPMTAIMALAATDIECVSKCFTGHSFQHGGEITPTEEIMLTELGNIVLNSLMSAVTNALKKNSMPAMPLFAEGDISGIAAGISRQVNPNQLFRIVITTIALKSDNSGASSCCQKNWPWNLS
jgi:hypothetical protein